MIKKNRIHLCIMIFCLILIAGCGRSKSGGLQNTADAGPAQGTADQTDQAQTAASPTPVPVQSQPVALFSGLASLDSYQTTTRIYSAGPGPDTVSETISEVQFNRAASATHNSMTTKSSDEDNPTLETQQQEQVTIGRETCSLEDGSWEYSQMDPQEKEMLSIFSKLYDVVPVISNPVFVGAESKNGVAANHFTFKVESAGAESGSVVTVNEGEYWLAVDGQYLLAYSLHLELRNSPESDSEAKVSKVEIEYSLENVNQLIDIQLPADCVP